MKTFEERFTAYVDGVLTGRELADFEQELAQLRRPVVRRAAIRRQHERTPNFVVRARGGRECDGKKEREAAQSCHF